MQWIRRYILFYDKRYPKEMDVFEIEAIATPLVGWAKSGTLVPIGLAKEYLNTPNSCLIGLMGTLRFAHPTGGENCLNEGRDVGVCWLGEETLGRIVFGVD